MSKEAQFNPQLYLGCSLCTTNGNLAGYHGTVALAHTFPQNAFKIPVLRSVGSPTENLKKIIRAFPFKVTPLEKEHLRSKGLPIYSYKLSSPALQNKSNNLSLPLLRPRFWEPPSPSN